MKFLKGFRKNYFSFSAITMYANAKLLQDNECFFKTQTIKRNSTVSEEEESPVNDELLALSLNLKEEGPKSFTKIIPTIHYFINPCNAPPLYILKLIRIYKGEILNRF